MIFYCANEGKTAARLTGSTSNAGRPGGGTPYYRIAGAGGISFLCCEIDKQIPLELSGIQVDPELIPIIRISYTHELAEKLGHLRPDDRLKLQTALKAVDEEEARMVRLFATGKITEAIWDNLWAEWQDRRHQLRRSLESLDQEREIHINNLNTALEIIAKIGLLYNSLDRSDQKELFHQVVERVVVNSDGKIRLELRTPFAYLKDLTDEIRTIERRKGMRLQMRTSGMISASSQEQCSNWLRSGWEDRNTFELSSANTTDFFHCIAFPQRAQLARFSDQL